MTKGEPGEMPFPRRNPQPVAQIWKAGHINATYYNNGGFSQQARQPHGDSSIDACEPGIGYLRPWKAGENGSDGSEPAPGYVVNANMAAEKGKILVDKRSSNGGGEQQRARRQSGPGVGECEGVPENTPKPSDKQETAPIHFALSKESAAEFRQYRRPVGGGPSSNT